jgi:hypothetical protein
MTVKKYSEGTLWRRQEFYFGLFIGFLVGAWFEYAILVLIGVLK